MVRCPEEKNLTTPVEIVVVVTRIMLCLRPVLKMFGVVPPRN